MVVNQYLIFFSKNKSFTGLAVGEEKFLSDASEVMDLLLKTHTEGEQLPADDPQTSFLISAWSRICRIMGKYKFIKIFCYFAN